MASMERFEELLDKAEQNASYAIDAIPLVRGAERATLFASLASMWLDTARLEHQLIEYQTLTRRVESMSRRLAVIERMLKIPERAYPDPFDEPPDPREAVGDERMLDDDHATAGI